jgi:hypothetical protein
MSCQRLVIGAAALRTVIDPVDNDQARHGGLLSRKTIRASDGVRVLLLRSARQGRRVDP